ncbi:MAG: S24/S26 family peptidase [Methanothermobacter sp.]|nr:S24/S26 family peptidase [Methanothermobacter sp.]
MKKSYILILLLLVVAIGTGLYIHENKTVNIIIETDGTTVTVKTSTLFFTPTPPGMEEEIADYMESVIDDPESTVDSIKADVKNIALRYGYSVVNVQLRSQFGVDQLPMPAKVKGNSMYPTLKDGQQLIVLKTKDFKVGDIVVAKHPEYGLIVKRVGKIEGDMVYLISDNKNVERVYTGTSIVIMVPLNTWVHRSDIIGVVKEVM